MRGYVAAMKQRISLLLLGLLWASHPAAAQMVSPLKGQGCPLPETRDVFLSVYLDRLLSVDDTQYRWEASFVFYISWADSTAHYIIANTTARVVAGEHTCARQCTDWADGISCCDGIYIPSFFFRNAYRFRDDRVTGAKMYALAPPNGSLLWTQVVQAEFYQPMRLSHYPFDSWDLLIALEFLDTTAGTPGHPGMVAHTSSAGTRLYTLGLGDAVSDWHVDSISLSTANSVDSSQLFKMVSDVPSDPRDPLPLSTGRAAVLRGTLPGPSSTSRVVPVRMIFVKIRISRFSTYHVLNTILPVALLGCISFVVFFLHRRDLAARLGVIVTLFLALAAVQFVISEHQPSSSYVLPTQQQVVCTYILLAAMAAESILVYHIETWNERTESARRRRLARDRVRGQRRGKTAAAAASAVAAADAGAAPAPAPAQADSEARGSQGAGLLLPPAVGSGKEHPAEHNGGLESGGGGHSAPPTRPASRLTRIKSLQADREYDAYVAYWADRAFLGAFLVLYTVATILIFTLQQGYISIFQL